jgi:hypothetical protein
MDPDPNPGGPKTRGSGGSGSGSGSATLTREEMGLANKLAIVSQRLQGLFLAYETSVLDHKVWRLHAALFGIYVTFSLSRQ